VLEIKNVPTQLILYAVTQWLPCQKYAKDKRLAKNTNQFIKAISVWLILKSETTSGQVKNYRSQLHELAAKCKMCVRTLERYIAWLRDEKLVHVENRNLYLHEYKILRKYSINITDRLQTIYYDTTDNKSLAEILIAIAMQKFKERWMKMYWNKLTQNPDVYKTLYDLLIYFKADASRLNDPEYFRQEHLKLMLKIFREDKPGHSKLLDFLHEYIEANPDLNARADTYAYKFNYNAAMSFCHLKFRLIKKGLISVIKEHVEGFHRARKDDKMFHLRWLRDVQHTIWFRCDQITINAACFYAKNVAA
jgi:hypothetical protein